MNVTVFGTQTDDKHEFARMLEGATICHVKFDAAGMGSVEREIFNARYYIDKDGQHQTLFVSGDYDRGGAFLKFHLQEGWDTLGEDGAA